MNFYEKDLDDNRMTKIKPLVLCTLVLASTALNGCSGVKNTLGLEKESPDEFAVITRAPLEIPTELTLPPPNLGAPRPQEQATVKIAKEAVFGGDKKQTKTESSAESILLEKARSKDVDKNIRSIVNKETAELNDRNKPVAEKLLNLTGSKKDASATIVDAKKEFERLQKNKKEGKSITEGKTPIIEE